MDDVVGPDVDEAREQIAGFLDALIWVYTLIIIAWIIFSFVFSMGLRVPYSRPLNAVLDFLRDVTEPYLRIFRRAAAARRTAGSDADRGDLRPADRRRHRREPDRSGPVSRRGGAALVAVVTVAADQAVKALVRSTIERGDGST